MLALGFYFSRHRLSRPPSYVSQSCHTGTSHVKDEHVGDEPVKDAAQDVAQDVTQDVAEDVSGAAEDGGVKVFIVAHVMFHRPPRFP